MSIVTLLRPKANLLPHSRFKLLASDAGTLHVRRVEQGDITDWIEEALQSAGESLDNPNGVGLGLFLAAIGVVEEDMERVVEEDME